MIPLFTRATARQDVLDQVHGNPDSDGTNDTSNRLITRAAREVTSDVDLRSNKRSVQLALSGQNDVIYEETDGTFDLPTIQAIGTTAAANEFACPNDLKGTAIIDLKARSNRSKEYRLTTQEEFDRYKLQDLSMIAVSDNSLLRKVLATGVPEITTLMIHDCDTYNGNGTFTAIGTATTIATEASDFVEGTGAVSFVSGTSGTTSGITVNDMDEVDLTSYEDDHDLFVWVYIPSTTDVASFTLRWGSSSANYWSVTVTHTHEQLAFYQGWNLLRFPWADATETGTPDASAVDFLSFFMTKQSGTASSAGWIVDRICASINSGHDLVYYSKYPWQTSTGEYLESAAVDADFLNADTDEYDLIVLRASELISIKLGKMEDAKAFASLYQDKRTQYQMRNPSESKWLQTSGFFLGSLEGESSTVYSSTD